MRRWRRWTVATTLGLGLTAGRPAPVHADDGGIVALVTLTIGLAIADATFATYDIVVGAKKELPSRGWTIAETVVTAPQTLLFNGMLWGFGAKEDSGIITGASFPIMGVTALTTHGIWGTASTKVDPVVLVGVSSSIGINTTLTGYNIARAVNRKLGSRSMGIAGMIVTAPQIAVSGVQLGTGASHRGAWIGLTTWSGVLFLHGLASAIWGGRREDPPPPDPPPPPPPPVDPPGDRSKPPLMVPAQIHFGPTMVTDGVARAPGVGIVGVF
jgi:hypothetical protein